RRHGVEPAEVLVGHDSAAVHALIGELVRWARELMHEGADLAHALPGRAGWELRLVVQGGLRILEKIDRLDGATLASRPVIGAGDAPRLAWRAMLMRPRRAARAGGNDVEGAA
ncbi:MAG: squalene/phytoene synthase family protein, partial [Caldimonas sp.]